MAGSEPWHRHRHQSNVSLSPGLLVSWSAGCLGWLLSPGYQAVKNARIMPPSQYTSAADHLTLESASFVEKDQGLDEIFLIGELWLAKFIISIRYLKLRNMRNMMFQDGCVFVDTGL